MHAPESFAGSALGLEMPPLWKRGLEEALGAGGSKVFGGSQVWGEHVPPLSSAPEKALSPAEMSITLRRGNAIASEEGSYLPTAIYILEPVPFFQTPWAQATGLVEGSGEEGCEVLVVPPWLKRRAATSGSGHRPTAITAVRPAGLVWPAC